MSLNPRWLPERERGSSLPDRATKSSLDSPTKFPCLALYFPVTFMLLYIHSHNLIKVNSYCLLHTLKRQLFLLQITSFIHVRCHKLQVEWCYFKVVSR